MFTLIENKDEITDYHNQLRKTIVKEFKRTDVKDIGYPGGTEYDAKVYTNGRHWVWFGDLKADTPNPRRLNWFGAFNDSKGVQIAVEINTPYIGASGNVAGFFARHNESGKVYLFHSGRVGGGTKGVGKTSFLAWSNHKLIYISDNKGGHRDGIVVMPVNAHGAICSATRYVDSIINFKSAVRAGEMENPEFKNVLKQYDDYYSESSGQRTGRRNNKIDYISRHGDVVDALHKWRKSVGLSRKSRIVNNVQIDMAVEENGVLTEVYEVKTSSGRTDLYTAVGQLMIHSSRYNCKKIMVLPHPVNLPDDISHAFAQLSIEVVEYDLDKNDAWVMDN